MCKTHIKKKNNMLFVLFCYTRDIYKTHCKHAINLTNAPKKKKKEKINSNDDFPLVFIPFLLDDESKKKNINSKQQISLGFIKTH